MNFTDVFFEFPIRIYDSYSMYNAEKQEDELEKEGKDLVAVPVDYIVGVKALRLSQIKHYMDVYSRDSVIAEVIENGFPCTLVIDTDDNPYECNWPRKEFKARLNKFAKELDDKITQEQESRKEQKS